MGGAIKQFGNWAGGIFKEKAPAQAAAAPQAAAAALPTQKTASAAVDEALAARRRARRSARALLSEQRLTPEQGVGSTTLGAGPMA